MASISTTVRQVIVVISLLIDTFSSPSISFVTLSQTTVNCVPPDADSDSDDEWNMLGRRVVSSKGQHLPLVKDGLTKVGMHKGLHVSKYIGCA